ncbi:MAG: hypothetical protein FJZ01_18340 [Candidatus Sericytochromatia bacterium]|nr:hypothetical protein [Candidatus Tanganyikabacteria bacterium]
MRPHASAIVFGGLVAASCGATPERPSVPIAGPALQAFADARPAGKPAEETARRLALDAVSSLRNLKYQADRVSEGYRALGAIHRALGENHIVVMGGYAAALTVQNSLDSQFHVLWSTLYLLQGGPRVPDREVFILGATLMTRTIDDRSVGLAYMDTVARHHRDPDLRARAAEAAGSARSLQGDAAVTVLRAAFEKFRDEADHGLPPFPGN